MRTGDLIILLIFWNIIGLIIAFVGPLESNSEGAFGLARGFEFVNPIFIYKHNRVNWFGAIMVCLVYSLICPIVTICYWVYKFIYFICTVGRKYEN